DHCHVYEKTLKQSAKLIGTAQVQGAQGQYHQIHHQEHRDSIEQAAHDPVVGKKGQPSASQAINRGCCERDEKVQQHTQDPCWRTSLECDRSSEQSCCDALRRPQTKGDKSGNLIECPGNC